MRDPAAPGPVLPRPARMGSAKPPGMPTNPAATPALSFTRLPTWLLVTLVLVPPAGASVFMQDAGMAKAALLALAGALALYSALAGVGSYLAQGGFHGAFRRLRCVYFILFNVLFLALASNLTQLALGSQVQRYPWKSCLSSVAQIERFESAEGTSTP